MYHRRLWSTSSDSSWNIKRDFFLDVYTILNRIWLTIRTIYAFRVLNTHQWSLAKTMKFQILQPCWRVDIYQPRNNSKLRTRSDLRYLVSCGLSKLSLMGCHCARMRLTVYEAGISIMHARQKINKHLQFECKCPGHMRCFTVYGLCGALYFVLADMSSNTSVILHVAFDPRSMMNRSVGTILDCPKWTPGERPSRVTVRSGGPYLLVCRSRDGLSEVDPRWTIFDGHGQVWWSIPIGLSVPWWTVRSGPQVNDLRWSRSGLVVHTYWSVGPVMDCPKWTPGERPSMVTVGSGGPYLLVCRSRIWLSEEYQRWTTFEVRGFWSRSGGPSIPFGPSVLYLSFRRKPRTVVVRV